MEKSIQEKLPLIVASFKKNGAISAYIFGSAATATMNKDSDVDFIFSFPLDLHYEVYSDNYFNLVHELESILNKNVDLVAEKTLKNPYLIEKINSQKIQIL
ncbi:MAG: nucleotidyltransferase family protein [Chitinophagales bacterium]|jgi:predicted nucleotidyltransferase|nr:nucleotidyltransferase domain-containing protein [Sphingobacteriales bacterium]